MSELERLVGETAGLTASATRLETLERRHHVLTAGFAKLERSAKAEHDRGRSAAGEIARLTRIDRWIRRGEVETLAIMEAALPVVASKVGHD